MHSNILLTITLAASILPFSLPFSSSSQWAHAAQNEKICLGDVTSSLQKLRSLNTDPDLRLDLGFCLVRYQLHRADVAQTALKILKDPSEDILLKEDLVAAFGEAELRKNEKVEESMAPEVNEQEKELLGRTVSSAQDILALTQAVKSMNEVSPVTRYESEFFRTLQSITLDDGNPVLLRAQAVQSLENASKKIVASGLYEERLIRQSYEAMRTVAGRDDVANWSVEVQPSMARLASAGLPYFKEELKPLPAVGPNAGRMLSSEAKPK